jgi:hypothetical protein
MSIKGPVLTPVYHGRRVWRVLGRVLKYAIRERTQCPLTN